MMLLFVRHAIALRRQAWTGDDDLRPLTPRGYDQAERLAELLAPFTIERVLSSPSTRCIETVQPLAARLGLPLEPVEQLAEGTGTAASALLEGLDGTIVVCSHGDVIPDLVASVAPSARRDDGVLVCGKASTWIVEDAGASARYLPPPA